LSPRLLSCCRPPPAPPRRPPPFPYTPLFRSRAEPRREHALGELDAEPACLGRFVGLDEQVRGGGRGQDECDGLDDGDNQRRGTGDRKSTRLNSSHDQISYAVFCLKKKKRYTA